MQSFVARRPEARPEKSNFRVARQARFGRAPRVLPAEPTAKRPARKRSEIEKDFESSFTRMAHLQRFRAVREAVMKSGEVHERVCRNYATYSDTSGNQFAVVKPLSDGGLRIGVGDFDGIAAEIPDGASGLGGSSRINHQFELESFEAIAGRQLGWLRRAYESAGEE